MTAAIPPGLLASLALVPPGSPFALLIRHADRAAFGPGEDGRDATLTTSGEARAAALSRHPLVEGSLPRWGECSPVPRCVATAALIGIPVHSNPLLGEPGAFVTDTRGAGEAFLQLGAEAVVRAHLSGHSWPFMRSPEAGARLVLADMATRLAARGGVGFFISHDAVIMPVIAWVVEEPFEGTWLAPLDGIVMVGAVEGMPRVLWQGRSFALRPGS